MTPATTTKPQPAADQAPEPAYLIFDTESVPDGRLLAAVKYAGENLTPEEAVRRCQDELRKQSPSGSDFVPVPLQYPVAICVVRVGADFTMQSITRLDEPHFKPRQIVEQFWGGLCKIKEKYRDRVKLVTFNGRGFDLPLLEMAAFRYGCALPRDYFATTRKRFESAHFDVMEFMGNYGAVRGGVSQNMLAKLLGKPGKMQVDGHSVYQNVSGRENRGHQRLLPVRHARPLLHLPAHAGDDGGDDPGRRASAGDAGQGVFAGAGGAVAGAGSTPGELGRLESLAIVVGTLRVP